MIYFIVISALTGLVFIGLAVMMFSSKSEPDFHSNDRLKTPNQDLAIGTDTTMLRYQTEVDQVRVDVLEAVKAYYDPGRGRFTAWWQRGRAEGRQRLSDALNNEQISVIQQGALLEQHIRDGLQKEAVFKTFITQNAAILNEIRIKQDLIEQALTRGYTLQTDQQIKLAEAESKIRTDEEERSINLRVTEHERRTKIDLNKRAEEIAQDVKAADDFELSEHQLLKNLRMNLKELLREQTEFAKGDDPAPVKRRMKARYEKSIENLENIINERERLVLFKNRQEAERAEANSTQGRRHRQEED